MTSLKLLNNSKKCCINLQYFASNRIPYSHELGGSQASQLYIYFYPRSIVKHSRSEEITLLPQFTFTVQYFLFRK